MREKKTMLIERIKTILILLPIAAAVIYFGGWVLIPVWTAILVLAAVEYWRMFRDNGFQPFLPALVGGIVLLAVARAVLGFQHADLILSIIILVVMAIYIFLFERGEDKPASGFTVTLGGILYLGWIGAYIISLRHTPDGNGLWWMLTALPAIWIADAWAYLVGKRFGRHRLSPRLSPKKTWEGYLGGIVLGTLCTVGLAAIWNLACPAITPLKGLIIGLVINTLAPLGDLGESLFKRQFGLKDSSNALPGHGGVFDRIDATLWAGVIGYYLALILK
jgi:phosphatidate cytidylyltransferase